MSFVPKLVLSAVIGTSLGMGLVWLTIKPPPPGMTETLRDGPNQGDEGDGPQGDDQADDQADEQGDDQADDQADDPTPTRDETDGDLVDPLSRRGASEPTLRFRRGRVAYIRCGARERCPRDRELEDAVWALLEAVPTCPDGPGSPGTGDVRVHFDGDDVEVRFRDWGDSPLALRPLRTCLESGVASLSTRLGVRPLTVSFRFELRPLR